MLIGLDFDNTIVSYDGLFHQVALEKLLIPASLPKSKLAVRDYLRGVNKEDAWTEMQGYVYGARMDDATAYAGAIEFMSLAAQGGISLAIVSHKTRHPFLGPKYDLHEAARSWVTNKLVARKLMDPDQVYFELTKDDKIRRVAEIGCDSTTCLKSCSHRRSRNGRKVSCSIRSTAMSRPMWARSWHPGGTLPCSSRRYGKPASEAVHREVAIPRRP